MVGAPPAAMSPVPTVVAVFTDADWASCKDDRRSTSACAIFYGGCLLHSSSRTLLVFYCKP